MKDKLLLLRNQLKMGHRISFAEAMLLQRAIDILVNKTGNSPAQSDFCPAQNHVSPEQNGDTPAQSQGWIPVSERNPNDIGRYWCYVEDQKSHGKYSYQWNCSWNGSYWSGAMMHGRVTHWMPLPAGPQEVTNGK